MAIFSIYVLSITKDTLLKTSNIAFFQIYNNITGLLISTMPQTMQVGFALYSDLRHCVDIFVHIIVVRIFYR